MPGPDTLTWHPVRAALGIRAFGCNAYTADAAGKDVVEPHTEEGADHEELYFVARGTAHFTIDGDEFDAPAGTYVFLPDPSSHRHATALEPGTTVLSFGGPPSFTPSAWEWKFRATPFIEGDPDRARAIVEEGLELHPDNPGLHWVLAKLAAAAGDSAGARAEVARVLEAAPGAVDELRRDPSLAPHLPG